MRQPSRLTVQLLARAVADPDIVARFRAKIVTIDGNDCAWWVGSLSGAGHGRFFLGRGQRRTAAIVAHRFAFALEHGVDALLQTPVLSHTCDNPPCQRVGPGHVTTSSAWLNRLEWSARRTLTGGPLSDPRGSLVRARDIRSQLLVDPAHLESALAPAKAGGVQVPLW